ncbi:hypothetical protein VTN77DRAFT_3635 [Rasamsonia byssochlamydoides]|uniref:uncharacterized protein n=1 Tax=Rasamsonia byssochlamydoides TaxID=89139 RepID=UPI003742A380
MGGDSTQPPVENTQQDGEDFEAHWFGFEEAVAKASHEDDRRLLQKAIETVQMQSRSSGDVSGTDPNDVSTGASTHLPRKRKKEYRKETMLGSIRQEINRVQRRLNRSHVMLAAIFVTYYVDHVKDEGRQERSDQCMRRVEELMEQLLPTKEEQETKVQNDHHHQNEQSEPSLRNLHLSTGFFSRWPWSSK